MNDPGDPLRAVRSALRDVDDHLRPTLREIRRVQQDTSERIATLQQQIDDYRAALAEVLRALEGAEVHPGLARGVRPVSVSIDDDDLRAAVADHPRGIAPRELRQALDVDPGVSTTQFSRFLSAALERGVVGRTGKGPGVR